MHTIVKKNQSLLEALLLLSPDSSKTTLRSWVEKGRVQVDGHPAKIPSQQVLPGQKVEVLRKTKFTREGIEILYEDKDIVVINKPEGLLSVATAFDKTTTAHCILKRRFHSQIVYPVHRLDRETSGVMVFAYSQRAKEHLKELFFHHDIGRTYFAIVENRIEEKNGSWKSYLIEDATYYVKSTSSSEKAKLAITHYEVAGVSDHFSFLRLKLQTGRKNQIRVHCKEAGFPIVGDQKYGALTNPLERLGLHAETLIFTHPDTKKTMHFEAPLPASFKHFMHKAKQ